MNSTVLSSKNRMSEGKLIYASGMINGREYKCLLDTSEVNLMTASMEQDLAIETAPQKPLVANGSEINLNRQVTANMRFS